MATGGLRLAKSRYYTPHYALAEEAVEHLLSGR
jgi:hypothetical protein